ncbi:arabinose operon transcriptional regulator AraC [Paenibacillus vulneris]|uniref:Helix-turn-helix domain-containing protein n=1 Tax=Paenibacillus vulneris TaxID=1133364 RepID=A0ABW3UW43_9BACL
MRTDPDNRTFHYDGKAYGIVIAGHFDKPDTYVTKRPEGMSDWLITYTLSGEGYFRTPGQETVCKAGDVTLLRAGTPHQYGTVSGQSWHFVWAHFSDRFMESRLLPEADLVVQSVDNSSSRKRIYRTFKKIINDFRERGEYWHELCLNGLREILLLLAQKSIQRLDARIEETLNYLSLHMRKPLRIDELSRSIGLSPSRLSHLFKESTGLSIIDTLNRMRIRQAALMIEHTDRSLTEIAYDVGYQNYNHFTKQFRKHYGVNPGSYKRTT